MHSTARPRVVTVCAIGNCCCGDLELTPIVPGISGDSLFLFSPPPNPCPFFNLPRLLKARRKLASLKAYESFPNPFRTPSCEHCVGACEGCVNMGPPSCSSRASLLQSMVPGHGFFPNSSCGVACSDIVLILHSSLYECIMLTELSCSTS